MPAGTKRAMTARAPWRVPAKYSKLGRRPSRIACVRLGSLVDVHKGLMVRIVRKHHGRDLHRTPARRGERIADVQPQGLPVRERTSTPDHEPASVRAVGDERSRGASSAMIASARRAMTASSSKCSAGSTSDRERHRKCARQACRRSRWPHVQVEIAEGYWMRGSRAPPASRQNRRAHGNEARSAQSASSVVNGNVRLWRSRPARTLLQRYLSLRTAACARGDVSRACRRCGARLRAGRPWRREDACPHAVPRSTLERQDVPLRADARDYDSARSHHCLSSSRELAREIARAVAMEIDAGPLHPELLRRRGPHGPAPGQGRKRLRRWRPACR